jgi:hypothetical protein
MMEESDAYSLGVAVGLLVQHYEVSITVDAEEFEDGYLRDEYDSGLRSAGVNMQGLEDWTDVEDDEGDEETGEEEPQTDLFHGGPSHANNPTEDGVYVIEVNGTPGLYSRYVSTMGWSHPSAVRRDLDRGTLPFIGWPYWNWREEE